MISKINNTLQWLPQYFARDLMHGSRSTRPKHVYVCICDHFEPYWNRADRATARKRIELWLQEYPKVAERYKDSDGQMLKYSFFYPAEKYQKEDLDALSVLCRAGYGEVEIHLHHDNDTSANLRRTLNDFKVRLHEGHGLLSTDRETGTVAYGFIHGNWALDNSRCDGRWCGVNDEITVLQETGCYGDFTLPSAPSETQTRKVNSIYYAVDDPARPKSHDRGLEVEVGIPGRGLLMVQGPLALSWHMRKFGVIPKIENGGLYASSSGFRDRVRLWIKTGVNIAGRPDHIFIKLYTHGAQEGVSGMLFGGGFPAIFEALELEASERNLQLHFVSAREMVNVIKAIEANVNLPQTARDYRYESALCADPGLKSC